MFIYNCCQKQVHPKDKARNVFKRKFPNLEIVKANAAERQLVKFNGLILSGTCHRPRVLSPEEKCLC